MDKSGPPPSIIRVSEYVVRVLGQNPGKFTLQGTNTYIVGRQNPYILIDTGEGQPEYIQVLEQALRETALPCNPTEPDISDIVLTHYHRDHVGGLPPVLALFQRLWKERNGDTLFTPPRIHKYPLPSGDVRLEEVVGGLPEGSYTPDPGGRPIHHLHDEQNFPIGSEGSLQILHTPGHTPDSICLSFALDKAVFTADTVLGQGTAVFEDLAAYITSLHKLLAIAEGQQLYPGHGPVIPGDGSTQIKTYIKHRQEREDQIMQVLSSNKPARGKGYWTTWSVVTVIYAGYPENLWLPAAHGVDLHLRKLEREGRVKRLGGDGKDTEWQLALE